MVSKGKKTNVASYLFFMLSPVLAAAVAFWNYRAANSKNILWLFVIFYAFTFTIPSEGSDAYRYRERFESLYYSNESLIAFSQYIYTGEYSPDTGVTYTDPYLPFLTYVLSRFTDNYRILYLFVGLIFGYFYSRNVWMLLENTRQRKLSLACILLLTVFVVIVPFWNLNSIRMWTAAHVFFYGMMRYFLYDQRKGIVIACSAFLIHFSFLLPIIVTAFYLFLGNRLTIYFGLYLFSFFVNEISISVVQDALPSFLPNVFQDKVDAYGTLEQSTKVDERSLHARVYGEAIRYFVTIFMVVFWFRAKELYRKYPVFKSLLSYSLLFLAVSQLASIYPSGGRFLIVSYLFAFALFFLSFQVLKDRVLRFTLFSLSPLLFLFVLVRIRVGIYSISMDLLGNPIVRIFGEVDISLLELLQ
ncbi:MAG: EpsG family protein [Cyanobacteria bacterium J06649_11]